MDFGIDFHENDIFARNCQFSQVTIKSGIIRFLFFSVRDFFSPSKEPETCENRNWIGSNIFLDLESFWQNVPKPRLNTQKNYEKSG